MAGIHRLTSHVVYYSVALVGWPHLWTVVMLLGSQEAAAWDTAAALCVGSPGLLCLFVVVKLTCGKSSRRGGCTCRPMLLLWALPHAWARRRCAHACSHVVALTRLACMPPPACASSAPLDSTCPCTRFSSSCKRALIWAVHPDLPSFHFAAVCFSGVLPRPYMVT